MSDFKASTSSTATMNKTERPSDYKPEPEEFERFADLTAKLLRVPKTELVDKLKES